MIPIVEERVGELQQLCIRYRVLRLDLFGSAATGNYYGRENDLDFLVEFQTLPSGEYADAYFGLLEALELLFGHPVDLVVDSAIKNPSSGNALTRLGRCSMRLEARNFNGS